MTIESPGSICDYFSGISDPRINRQRRHELIDVLVIAVLAAICGADTWVSVATFGKAKLDWLKTFLALPNGIPSHDTFGRVFAVLDPDAFARCFLDWIKAVSEMTAGGVIAIDGKTIRGSFDKALGKGAIHMVSAWSCASGIVLGQRKVDDKSNEITAIPKLLELLDLHGAFITIDAMGCQKAIAEKIVSGGGDYVLALKGNQSNLHEDVKLIFDGATPEALNRASYDHYTTTDGDHGRIETRSHWTMDDLSKFPTANSWKKLTAIGVVERVRDFGHKVEQERSYYLLSSQMAAKAFANAARSHWQVESMHWSLDVSFSEDASRVRKNHAPENLSTLRKIGLALLKKASLAHVQGGGGIATKRLAAGWDNAFLLKVLTNGG